MALFLTITKETLRPLARLIVVLLSSSRGSPPKNPNIYSLYFCTCIYRYPFHRPTIRSTFESSSNFLSTLKIIALFNLRTSECLPPYRGFWINKTLSLSFLNRHLQPPVESHLTFTYSGYILPCRVHPWAKCSNSCSHAPLSPPLPPSPTSLIRFIYYKVLLSILVITFGPRLSLSGSLSLIFVAVLAVALAPALNKRRLTHQATTPASKYLSDFSQQIYYDPWVKITYFWLQLQAGAQHGFRRSLRAMLTHSERLRH